MRYTIALSPCPNDTFMFHGLMNAHVTTEGIEPHITMLDIQELNTAMANEKFDFCKVSSVAALRHQRNYELCQAGAALGYGVGPLLLKRAGAEPLSDTSRVLCPGAATTAYALFSFFYSQVKPRVHHALFSDIMPALARAEADYGVVIHEGRFTYQTYGLQQEADLGSLWEQRFGLPLPLGCMVAHRRVSEVARQQFAALVRSSIEYAYQNRAQVFETMKRYAQELDDKAIWAHVDLYVNQWSLDLGDQGLAAFAKLGELVSGNHAGEASSK
jgi:1,4-dihydroxy-6-naphthoate synthase